MNSKTVDLSTVDANSSWLEQGRCVLREESAAINAVADRMTPEFEKAVSAMLACKGRIAITGMGKHGIVARKTAATLSSTGTPSFFLHPGEALHGDLGMVDRTDVILALSNSGNTEELLSCLPFYKRNGNTIIAMTGNLNSELARQADIVIDIGVEKEVCPLNLAPTTSTTVAMAMGDAFAVVLLAQRGFQPGDFAIRHPNGALGRLFKRVRDLMKNPQNPVVAEDATFGTAVEAITAARHGAASVVNTNGQLVGILTDGDVRRALQREAQTGGRQVADVFQVPVKEVMTLSPLSVSPDVLAEKAVSMMEDGPRKVLVLPVVDEENRPLGMIHLHDLVGY